MSRSTLGKTAASPAPRSMRAAIASRQWAKGHHELADRHQDHADRDDRTRAVAVEQHADRNLHEPVHAELQHREHRQRRRVGIEPFGRSTPTADSDVRFVIARSTRRPRPPDQPGAPRRSGQSGEWSQGSDVEERGSSQRNRAPGYAGDVARPPRARRDEDAIGIIAQFLSARHGAARMRTHRPYRRARTRRARER